LEVAEKDCLDGLTGSRADRKQPALSVTGLEVLAFVAGKIVVPIVCAFAKDVLFEQYKRIRSKKELQQARAELAKQELQRAPTIDLEILRKEAIAAALEEGLSEDRARALVDQALKTVSAQAAKS
jgi:hypothetical protein